MKPLIPTLPADVMQSWKGGIAIIPNRADKVNVFESLGQFHRYGGWWQPKIKYDTTDNKLTENANTSQN